MSQVYYRLYCHIIWTTKNRQPIIDEKIESFLKQYIPLKIKKSKYQLLSLNMVNDHLHLLVSCVPSVSISEFVNRIKGSSSHEINLRFPDYNFYWQSGYSVLSVSEKGISGVKEYIEKQKEHHKNNSLIKIIEYSPNN